MLELTFDAGTVRITGDPPAALPGVERDDRSKSARAPAYRYADLRAELDDCGLDYTDRVLDPYSLELSTAYELRGSQQTALDAWREHASTLGRRVRVETPGGEVVGEAVDVQFPGTLVVDTGDERVTVTAGDCEHLRPV